MHDASANKTFVTWAGAGMDIRVRGDDVVGSRGVDLRIDGARPRVTR